MHLSPPTTTAVDNSRATTLADPGDPFSVLEQVDTRATAGTVTETTYTSGSEKRIVTTSHLGRDRIRELDELGREVMTQTEGLHPVRRVYDPRGRVLAINEGPEPETSETRTTTLGYWETSDHRNGLLWWVQDPLGRTIHLDYDAAGRIVEGTLPDGRMLSATYDDNGNLSSITPPGRPAHGFGYTPMNLESKYDPPLPEPTPLPAIADPATYYAYNDDGQMTHVTRPDGGVIEYVYDDSPANTGQLQTEILPAGQGQIGYTYHPEMASSGAGLVETITAPDGGVLSYSYFGSLVFQEIWDGSGSGMPSGSVERVYDSQRRVSAQTINYQSPAIAFLYDDDGFLTNAGDLTLGRDPENGLLVGSLLGAVSDTYLRNDFGEVTDYTAAVSGTPVLETTYGRDEVGRIDWKTEAVEGGAVESTFYEYDTAGRLYRVCDDAPCAAIRAEYTYDLNGNRTGGFDEVSGAITATYDTQDRLLAYDGASYTYTANGELTSKTDASGTTTYVYDALGNLRHVELPGGTDIDYVIDGRNRRIGKKVDGSLVQALRYEDQLRPVAELDPNGVVVSRFVYGERPNVPEYIVKGGSTYRIVHDHLGSPRLVIDAATGTVAQRLDYDAFGNVLADTNPGFQPFGFAGGLWDRDTGLVRFGARDYDPVTGRWTAKDPIGFEGGDLNLFGYVHQNPAIFIDPTGRAAITERLMFEQLLFGGILITIAGLIETIEVPDSPDRYETDPGGDPGDFIRICIGGCIDKKKGFGLATCILGCIVAAF